MPTPRAALAVLCVVAGALPASAHPHVWADMRSQLVVSDDGLISGHTTIDARIHLRASRRLA